MLGTIAALSCAMCWAIAARLFKRLGNVFNPLALNFWKGVLSIALLLTLSWIFLPPPELSLQTVLWLLLSGAIGIGIGDTFFFLALNRIGDNQSLLVAETLAPILTGVLGIVWLAEWLSWLQWLGIAVIIISVDFVIKANQSDGGKGLFAPTGYLLAAIAALCQAVGAIISRDMLVATNIDPYNASLIRLVGGVVLVIVLMIALKRAVIPRQIMHVNKSALKQWAIFALATVVGTFFALSLQMLAFSHAKAAVVQTLFGTSVLFSLMLALLLGEKVNFKALIWSAAAVVGVGLLMVGE